MSASVSASRCGASYQISVAASPARSAARMCRTLRVARPGAAAGNPAPGTAAAAGPTAPARYRGIGARHRPDRQPLRHRRAHQAITGIRHQRHAGIRHQRDPLAPAAAEPAPPGWRVLVVLVQRLQLHLRPDRGQQSCGVAGVLAQDQIGGRAASPGRAASGRRGCRSGWKPAQDHRAGRTGRPAGGQEMWRMLRRAFVLLLGTVALAGCGGGMAMARAAIGPVPIPLGGGRPVPGGADGPARRDPAAAVGRARRPRPGDAACGAARPGRAGRPAAGRQGYRRHAARGRRRRTVGDRRRERGLSWAR